VAPVDKDRPLARVRRKGFKSIVGAASPSDTTRAITRLYLRRSNLLVRRRGGHRVVGRHTVCSTTKGVGKKAVPDCGSAGSWPLYTSRCTTGGGVRLRSAVPLAGFRPRGAGEFKTSDTLSDIFLTPTPWLDAIDGKCAGYRAGNAPPDSYRRHWPGRRRPGVHSSSHDRSPPHLPTRTDYLGTTLASLPQAM
jgi:hypothetical protein